MEFSSIVGFVQNTIYIAVFLLVVVLGLLYTFQNKLLYMPVIGDQPRSPAQNPIGVQHPGDRGLPYSNVTIQTLDSQTLKGWICLQPNSSDVPTVIYMHENAGSNSSYLFEDIGTRIFYMEYYYKHVGVNVILVAYRGYSDSTGEPSEQGLQLDGEAMVKYALNHEQLNQDKIFIHGRSLGGAVTAHVMSQPISKRIAGVILENTFTSISDMVDVIFPKIRFFKPLVQRNFWSSIDKIPNITQPILFVISMKDEIVPAQHMVELSSRARSARFSEKFVIENGTHNGNWALDIKGYFSRVKNFIDRAQIE